MPNSELYDAIIVGGGPAGLSIGAELSKKNHKVLVLEKGEIGQTARSWIVPGYIMAKLDPEVQQYAYNGVKRFLEYTPDFQVEWDTVGPWDVDEKWKVYSYIDQKGILTHWADIINNNNSKTLNNNIYLDYIINDDIVTVKTAITNSESEFKEYKGRLLIDASGYSSEVAKKSRVSRDGYFWWSVYGWDLEFDDITKLKHPGNFGNMKVGDYMLWQSFEEVPMNPNATLSQLRPIVEYEVLDEKRIFVFILFFCDNLVSKDFLKSTYNNVVQTCKSMESFRGGKQVNERFGWYPSGGVSQQIALDKIAFVGDSGCWTIPAGWGMSFILDNYVRFAEQISEALNNNKLDKKTLDEATKLNVREKYEILMDKVVLHFLSYAEPKVINKFTQVVKEKFGGGRLETMFCLQMTEAEALETMMAVWKNFTWEDLKSIKLPKEDILLLAEAVGHYGESWMNTILRKLFGYQPEKTGFEFD